jgi:hypothetical protein
MVWLGAGAAEIWSDFGCISGAGGANQGLMLFLDRFWRELLAGEGWWGLEQLHKSELQ